jgi:hypothetical protein
VKQAEALRLMFSQKRCHILCASSPKDQAELPEHKHYSVIICTESVEMLGIAASIVNNQLLAAAGGLFVTRRLI